MLKNFFAYIKERFQKLYDHMFGESPNHEIFTPTYTLIGDDGTSHPVDWGIYLTKVYDSWKRTKGKSIKIAVLDTGTDLNNPDLLIKESISFIEGEGPQDTQGHGTFVCSIIAGQGVAQKVVKGISPNCTLYVAKVLGNNGKGSLKALAKGIEWAISKEVDIINMSLGWLGKKDPEIAYFIEEAQKRGIVLVAAAGNEAKLNTGDEVCWPARHEEVIAVASVHQQLKRSNFSSRGSQVEISAPGSHILGLKPGGGIVRLSGTSFASPFVAGVIGLMKSKHPEYDLRTVRRKLQETAIDLEDPGKDDKTGHGLINPPLLARNRGLNLGVDIGLA
jgi:subtilisin family serine protease